MLLLKLKNDVMFFQPLRSVRCEVYEITYLTKSNLGHELKRKKK